MKQAFPFKGDYVVHPGMSLRDWFAGQALAGILASKYPGGPTNVADNAYAYAAAMLAVSKKYED